mgnify:CR=1 FL=1
MSEEAKEPVPRVAKPVKKMPEKASPRTVKGKIAAIQKQMEENQKAIAAFHAAVCAQVNQNKEAVAAIYSGVRAIQSAISEQMKENQAYVSDFYG